MPVCSAPRSSREKRASWVSERPNLAALSLTARRFFFAYVSVCSILSLLASRLSWWLIRPATRLFTRVGLRSRRRAGVILGGA